MIKLQDLGRNVAQFIYFKEVQSHFGLLHLVEAEKDGYAKPKGYFNLDKIASLIDGLKLINTFSTVDII